MNWSEFNSAVNSGELKTSYIFKGPEEWTKRKALENLRKTILPAGLEQLNDTVLENASVQSIIDCAETLPVMCDKRIVTVNNWAPFKGEKGSDKNNDIERLRAWLEDMPETTILIFYLTEEPSDKNKAYASIVPLVSDVVDFTQISGSDLNKWCSQQLKPFKKRISPDALNEMCMMVGQSLTQLNTELGKLAAFTEERSVIEAEDVREVVTPSTEYRVFVILDYLLAGKIADACAAADFVTGSGTSSVGLINLLASQLRTNMHVKYAFDENKSDRETAKLLNIREYRIKYIRKQTGIAPAEAFQKCYQLCVNANFEMTSGQIREREGLYQLLYAISAIFTKAKASGRNSIYR